jgi:hypothetical protein
MPLCELHTSRNCCTISLSGVGCVCEGARSGKVLTSSEHLLFDVE